MSISSERELLGMQKISQIVANTLKQMREFVKPGMSAWELDQFGGNLLSESGANSAPYLTYGFPGWTCISLNHEIAHGIPTKEKIFKEGDLINIDVSAEMDGFWSDNGGSFVLGNDIHNHEPLVNASKKILSLAIQNIKSGVKISEIGKLIETTAHRSGFKVIRNLAGHGVGKSLHEPPLEILNCYDPANHQKFKKNAIVAIETFISTKSTYANQCEDGWTLLGNKGGYVAQHEHSIMVTDHAPIILTEENDIWKH